MTLQLKESSISQLSHSPTEKLFSQLNLLQFRRLKQGPRRECHTTHKSISSKMKTCTEIYTSKNWRKIKTSFVNNCTTLRLTCLSFIVLQQEKQANYKHQQASLYCTKRKQAKTELWVAVLAQDFGWLNILIYYTEKTLDWMMKLFLSYHFFFQIAATKRMLIWLSAHCWKENSCCACYLLGS